MTTPRSQPFDLPALERLATIIGDRYSWREMTNFFTDAGVTDLQTREGETAKWRFAERVLRELQRQTNGTQRIAQIIERLCSPQSFFGQADVHLQMLTSVNEVLSHYTLRVDRSGRVVVDETVTPQLRSRASPQAVLFDSRQFHPEVRKHARQLFVERRHFHAVFECCKAFDGAVRAMAQSSKHGSELMGAALSKTGALKLNTLRTETEVNEQEGYMHLCMGLMRAIRNPLSHEPEYDWPMAQEDALDMLSLLSYLFRQLDKVIYYGGPQGERS